MYSDGIKVIAENCPPMAEQYKERLRVRPTSLIWRDRKTEDRIDAISAGEQNSAPGAP
jgi:hypothetical protein